MSFSVQTRVGVGKSKATYDIGHRESPGLARLSRAGFSNFTRQVMNISLLR